MLQKSLFLTLAALLLALVTPSQTHAWGACHVGYTHVGYGGVQHYGSTSVSGRYGSYSGSHYGSYGTYGSSHAYSGTAYGTQYNYGGYHTTATYGGSVSRYGYHYGY